MKLRPMELLQTIPSSVPWNCYRLTCAINVCEVVLITVNLVTKNLKKSAIFLLRRHASFYYTNIAYNPVEKIIFIANKKTQEQQSDTTI